MVTCSGVGVQRHVTLVSIDYPKAMRLPGTQIMDVSVPFRPPPVGVAQSVQIAGNLEREEQGGALDFFSL